VIHLVTPFGSCRAAARLASERGIPLTASFHCQAENLTNHFFLMNAPFVNRAVYREFYDHIFRFCDCIHYPSQFICDTFESLVGETRHYVISNGVQKFFRPGREPKPEEFAGKFVLLFTGRYSKEKSHRVLIDAVCHSRFRDSIQLVFAGMGPLEGKLRAYAKKRLPVQPVFRFFSRAELLRLIQSADLYVHPAEIEIEAIACLEAITCGLVPVIANSPRCATKAFALTERNLFRCNDSVDLAKKIDYWIDHPMEREECSRRYMGYAQQFDFDVCMDNMERMFKDAARIKYAKGVQTEYEEAEESEGILLQKS